MTVHVTADRILRIATGYMDSQLLFQASRVGLFDAVAAGATTVDQISDATGISPTIARILADAMAAQGMLQRQTDRYALEADAAAYLTGGPESLHPFLHFLDQISYPHWMQFARTVDSGEPGDLGMNPERWDVFLDGVMTYNRLHAREYARLIDLADARTVLDFGGLSAAFAVETMLRHPLQHTTFLYEEAFLGGVAEAIDAAGLSDRVDIVAGETATAEPIGAYDAVFANHVIHRFDAEANAAIFARLRRAARAGAVLTVLDFFSDVDDVPRRLDARHAAEYLVIDGTVVYPEVQVRRWLADAGWRVERRVALPGSPRVLVAVAV
ncbi:uncharacterized protein with FMN-binding domain [Microbacterium sp. SORGH_AS 1204]|uniref:methyltransferase family protein n=1 Tax=Microbacterium sp. SORGH_AS_1204 TaxID=3041785 RepID=UPI00278F43AE|nr:methyltransferase dimerization domain-containing protein [Microbacterium sp. SORGH_AS_1204]MDQ1136314.1 uncharacterized protein with FMN-binding domain [Microbacterium sp. SORGH_AS_1204]